MSTGEIGSPRRIVRVLPDVTGINRSFAYSVPEQLAEKALVGAVVRVPLRGRKVRGWILGDADEDRPSLWAIDDVVSLGPSETMLDLCRLGAWRYAGRMRPFLLAASPSRSLLALPPASAHAPRPVSDEANPDVVTATKEALGLKTAVLRIPPSAQRLDAVLAAIDGVAPRDLIVLVPEHHDAEILSRRLEALGLAVAAYPELWGSAAAGGRVVVGTRSAVYAPAPNLGAIVVIDSHSEAYAEQRAPTWDATTMARLRARQEDVPCVLVSPCPPVTQLQGARLVTLARPVERDGWARAVVIDRRGDDPHLGLFAPRLAETIREARRRVPEHPFVCLLNRKGRARLAICTRCHEVARCEHCGAAVRERRDLSTHTSEFSCDVCGTTRPVVCANCGSTKFARRGLGTERVAEELAALVGEPVLEVTGDRPVNEAAPTGVVVGTEAVLHRVRRASAVCFLDFDQELLAPRYRAFEEALVLLARASRLVGGRGEGGFGGDGPGTVYVQTNLPDHEVLAAAVHGDPTSLETTERARRTTLGLPPARALAVVDGDEARAIASGLTNEGIEVGELSDGRVLVRSFDAGELADALSEAGLPKQGVRVAVDPLRL